MIRAWIQRPELELFLAVLAVLRGILLILGTGFLVAWLTQLLDQ
jgi:hypothetical protein